MTKLKFAELQTPLFFNGINFGCKLDTEKRAGLQLYVGYIDLFKCTIMVATFKGMASLVFQPNMVAAIPEDSAPFIAMLKSDIASNVVSPQIQQPIAVAPTPITRKPGRPSAQVSTPTSHVFEPPKV
jgi:hypothetical protein